MYTIPMVLFGIFRYLYLVYQSTGIPEPDRGDPPGPAVADQSHGLGAGGDQDRLRALAAVPATRDRARQSSATRPGTPLLRSGARGRRRLVRSRSRRGSAEAVSYDARISDECFDLEDDSFWFAHRQRCILAAFARRPSPDGVVDVGGGNGFVAQGFLRAGIPVLLLEPSAIAVRNARQRGLPDVVCATVQSAGLRPESAPAIGLFDVLEHIADDRCVPPRAGAVPSPRRPPLFDGAIAALAVVDRGHLCRPLSPLPSARPAALLEESGLILEYSSYLFAPLVLPVFLLRGAASLLRCAPPGIAHPQHARAHPAARMAGSADAGRPRPRAAHHRARIAPASSAPACWPSPASPGLTREHLLDTSLRRGWSSFAEVGRSATRRPTGGSSADL